MSAAIHTIEEALAFIHGCNARGGVKDDGIKGTVRLLKRLGDPQKAFRSVHVAGTNGKGSTCAFIESALRASGYKTGLFTSPFLQVFNERMKVNGRNIPDEQLVALTAQVARAVEGIVSDGHPHPTEFEVVTALGFLYFARENIDIAAVEVGLGGRLDPTSAICPTVCVITSICLDHCRLLGDTPALIAAEKGGIIKANTPLVLGRQRFSEAKEVLFAMAGEKNAPLWDAEDALVRIIDVHCRGAVFDLGYAGHHLGDIVITMAGRHQVDNAVNALLALWRLREEGVDIPDDAILQGMKEALWPGRCQWLRHRGADILLDGAHNADGVAKLAGYLDGCLDERAVLLCGVMRDKDLGAMIRSLKPHIRRAVAVSVHGARVMPAGELKDRFLAHGIPAMAAASVASGLGQALDLAQGGPVVVCGSLHLVGAVLNLIG
ncbi:MAG: bifunctional folylpolyglutamate synthase/dihydrofolate synthase [Christensenellales bacterium]|jgi:dihydrofolate synthase/folylpolyglutamate synthase